MPDSSHTITFVHAPDIRYDQSYGTYFSPLWAYTLASYVPDGWKVFVHDCKIDEFSQVPRSDIFAFSGKNQDIDSIRAAYDQITARFPDALFILGGPMTWSLQKEGKLHLLDYFDYVFIMDGEETLPAFLNAFKRNALTKQSRVIEAMRFPLGQSRKIRIDLLRPKARHYYGGVVEVSRGCPFLCEFCDIRVLPGNNVSHNKPPALVVEELDEYYQLGVTQIQFACDNFIGDVAWARQCVDAILAWKERTQAKVSIFTWLTINVFKMPDLLAKMRRAGFSVLYIGIESVNRNSLLETAKIQNIPSLQEGVKTIQAYGFIIAPGYIFGFDSDTARVFDDTLRFMVEVGIIGGDPSFLTALPGTPLHKRMERVGRLVEDQQEEVTMRLKIQTNIRYLLDADFLKTGFLRFLDEYNGATFQYARFKTHMKLMLESDKFVENDGVGYGSPFEYLKLQVREAQNRQMLFLRLAYLLRRPAAMWAVFRAWRLMKRASRRYRGMNVHFIYWLYWWTNIGLKYRGLKKEDMQLHSVDKYFQLSALVDSLPDGEDHETHHQERGSEKTGAQARYTNQALKRLVEERAASPVETSVK